MAPVHVATIRRIEAALQMYLEAAAETVWKIQKALEAAGIEFISEEAGMGPGVRLKQARDEPALTRSKDASSQQPTLDLPRQAAGGSATASSITGSPCLLAPSSWSSSSSGLREGIHQGCLVPRELSKRIARPASLIRA